MPRRASLRQKLGAALTAVVKQEQSTLPPDQLLADRQQQWELSPGTVMYLGPSQSIEIPQLPNADGYETSLKFALREVATGMGITFEALSGNLENVNFSSGRLGDLQFRANVNAWQWHLLAPKFLNPSFKVFLKYCAIKGVDTTGIKVDWVMPARQMISPTDEISAAKESIRSGLQTLPGALRELGLDPEQHLREVAKSNELIDQLGLILDSDPRRTGNGQLQSSESFAAIKEDQKS